MIAATPQALAAEPLTLKVAGVEGDALKNVREILAFPPGLVQDGTVDRLWLERFAKQAEEKVRTALEPFGYYEASVDVRIREEEPGVFQLLVVITPGVPVIIDELELELHGPGAAEPSLQRLAADFPLEKEDVLLQRKYEEAKEALLAKAWDLGYLDADFSVHEIRIGESRLGARIHLRLETGQRYFFGGTSIKGAPDYPDEFLRRYLAFKPGDVFSYGKLGETQLNFANSERFKEINITPEKSAAQDFRIPVIVKLSQNPSRILRQGIGYGTDTGARINIRYRDLNMRDRGQELYSNLYISEHLKGLATGYIVPDPMDMKTSTSLQLNLQQEDVTTYSSRLLALELSRSRSLGKNNLGAAYLKLQQEDYTIGLQDGNARLVLPGLRFSGGRSDSLRRPTRAFHYAFDLRGTHQVIGSDTGLLQLISRGSYLLPLFWRLSLHTRAKAGITLLSDPLSDLPVSLRFFAGGDESVRGYAYQSLGPRDASGQVVGGKNLLSGSLELERALFQNWGVSLFYDAGNAFDSFTNIHLAQGAGVGLHYYTPVGALNLSLARQVGVSEPNFHVHFTVGFEF